MSRSQSPAIDMYAIYLRSLLLALGVIVFVLIESFAPRVVDGVSAVPAPVFGAAHPRG